MVITVLVVLAVGAGIFYAGNKYGQHVTNALVTDANAAVVAARTELTKLRYTITSHVSALEAKVVSVEQVAVADIRNLVSQLRAKL
jgi:hypothetical protein